MKNLSRTFAGVLIIAATFLVYGPALRNGFVWDDTALVLRDPLIRSWVLIPEGFRHFLFLDATASNFYRPIQRLSFVFDYAVFGFGQPGGWHFTSILIHAGAAVALFFVLEKLLALFAATRMSEAGRRGLALGIALLWAIHPLHTSAVTYIAGRADPLAALFGFTALALGLASLQASRRAGLWRLGAAVGFALALLSKESGIGFLLIWLLVLFWRRENRRGLAFWAALIALVIGGYCALRFTAHKTPPPSPPPTPLTIRPILAARAFAEYAALLVAPVTLRMERDVSTKPRDTYEATMQNARHREYQTLAGVLLLLGFGWWGRAAFRQDSLAALALAAFTVAYLPISNLFSLNATLAEHWLYVPSAFLLLAAALTISRLLTASCWRHPLIILTAIWAVLLGARTLARQADWRDQRTFIERTIAGGGDSARMLMNLANLELAGGQPERALALYREALRRAPEQPIIWLGYAHVLLRAGDFPAARQALEKARVQPMLAADCLLFEASLNQAESRTDPGATLRAALDIAPERWSLRQRHLAYLAGRGDLVPARQELLAFLGQYSFRAESWKLLGEIFHATGEPARAAIAYREAARRDVRDEESRVYRPAETPAP